jgi:small subunit ribosomal protein S1
MAEEKIINNEQRDDKEKKKDLGELYEKSFRELTEEEIVRGRVVEVGKEFVTIDVGYKSVGQVPLSEFDSRENQSRQNEDLG